MLTKTLPNNLKLIYRKTSSNSVTINIQVNTGSNYESSKQRGISHFIEHMVFEGTKKRSNSTLIANEIEKLGGEFNAYTTNERTCFYIKVLSKHFLKALDILSDIIQDPLLSKESFEKEKQVILKEINMINDEPRFYQWILFQKNLFSKFPAKYPTYGSKESVSSFTVDDLKHYMDKYYTPDNIMVSVVGNVKDPQDSVKKYFNFKKQKKAKTSFPKITRNKKTIAKQKRQISNSYMVLGYKTVNRKHKDSYVLDVIKCILGRGQSGRIVEQVRNKYGLAYEVNVHHESEPNFGFFAVYLNTEKKNLAKCRSLVLKELFSLNTITKIELDDAKGYLEGQFLLEHEDTKQLADSLSFWQQIGDAKLFDSYIRNIKKVSIDDIKRVSKRYFKKNYTIAIIEEK